MLASASEANACTVVGTVMPKKFIEKDCIVELRKLINFANTAHSLPLSEVSRWLDYSNIDLEGVLDADHVDDWWDIEEYRTNTGRQYGFLKHWRLSDGKVDPKPLSVVETNIVRKSSNGAIIQFGIKRYYYSKEYDGGSCEGRSEGYYNSLKSYLGVFNNNRLLSVKHFPEWFV